MRDALKIPFDFSDSNVILGLTMYPPYWVKGPDGEVDLIVLKQAPFYTPSEWSGWSYGSVGFPNQVGYIYNSTSTPEPASCYLIVIAMMFSFLRLRMN